MQTGTRTGTGSTASGWSVVPFGTAYRWSAYGERGSRNGEESTRARAEGVARQAYDELRRPLLAVVREA